MLPRTISKLREMYAQRTISPSEVLAESTAIIKRKNPSVKAWAELHIDEARALARSLDQMLSRVSSLPPLFGVPYGAKDIFHTAGWRTEAGSKVIRKFVPDDNATVVDRLHAQSALLIGKTTTTEFANLGGPPETTNPWNPEHTPGGSSSGSSAAVSSGMVFFALGTQTAGSLSRPAAFNGLTVLKASYGRISKAGVIPASDSLDHVGAFTRDVEDSVLFYNAVSGSDPRDPTTQNLTPLTLEMRAAGPLTLGVLDTAYFKQADADVLANYEVALNVFATTGYSIIKVSTPSGFEESVAAHALVMQAEVAHYHRRYFTDKSELYTPSLRDFIQEGLSISADRYIDAQTIRARYKKQFEKAFASADIIVTPTTPTSAPHGLGATGSPAFNLPFSNLGVPTLAIPCGFSDSGLPTSIQLIAPMWQEQRLIDAGRHFQSHTDWHLRSPD